MNLRKLGLKTKIAVGFGSLLAIIAAMGVIGYRSAVVGQKTSQESEIDSAKKDVTSALQQAMLKKRIGERDVMMGRDNESTHLFEHSEADFNQALEELKPLLSKEEDQRLYAQVVLAGSGYARRNEQVVAMYRAGDTKGAM